MPFSKALSPHFLVGFPLVLVWAVFVSSQQWLVSKVSKEVLWTKLPYGKRIKIKQSRIPFCGIFYGKSPWNFVNTCKARAFEAVVGSKIVRQAAAAFLRGMAC